MKCNSHYRDCLSSLTKHESMSTFSLILCATLGWISVPCFNANCTLKEVPSMKSVFEDNPGKWHLCIVKYSVYFR